MVSTGLKVKESLEKYDIRAGLYNPRFIKPMDSEGIIAAAKSVRLLVTLEDNVEIGGFGEQVAALLKEKNVPTDVMVIGWPDRFVEHGSCEELNALYHLDAEGITERIRKAFERTA